LPTFFNKKAIFFGVQLQNYSMFRCGLRETKTNKNPSACVGLSPLLLRMAESLW